MREALIIFIVACGGKPAAQPTIANKPGAAAPTCADAGVILRGSVDADDANAGPAREAAIAHACESDRWDVAVVACVTTRPSPASCLDKLTPQQHESYDTQLASWSHQYGGAGD